HALCSLEIWQTDVTHIMESGRLKYVHGSIDTHSSCIFASTHTRKWARDIKRHLLQAFATLGVPASIKTDNAPGYTSSALKEFFQNWGIQHITGIPHSPTGQAIVE
ncbi:POK25 protein, partial [Anseranas semipalmata]|nr:POK25 protein [Anseranas semipalmata]